MDSGNIGGIAREPLPKPASDAPFPASRVARPVGASHVITLAAVNDKSASKCVDTCASRSLCCQEFERVSKGQSEKKGKKRIN